MGCGQSVNEEQTQTDTSLCWSLKVLCVTFEHQLQYNSYVEVGLALYTECARLISSLNSALEEVECMVA